MKRLSFAAAAVALLIPALVLAHAVEVSISQRDATVIHLHHADGSPFAGHTYQLFPPGETEPWLSGRTDDNGVIAFVPDRAGEWRVRAFSDDGHGVDTRFTVNTSGAVATDSARGYASRWSKISVGVGLIFATFGVLSLIRRRA